MASYFKERKAAKSIMLSILRCEEMIAMVEILIEDKEEKYDNSDMIEIVNNSINKISDFTSDMNPIQIKKVNNLYEIKELFEFYLNKFEDDYNNTSWLFKTFVGILTPYEIIVILFIPFTIIISVKL